MMLVGTSVFFMPLAYLLFLHLLLVLGGGLGSNSEPGDPFDAEPSSSFVPESPSPTWPTWLFPTLCALGVVVPMVIAIRIVVRNRA